MKKTIPTIVMAMLCLIFTTKAQQTINLTGKIIASSDSKPLSGATIKIKDEAGVLSNSEGRFTIKTSSPKGLLIISFTGYKTVEVPFSKDYIGPFNIILQEEESALKEVEVNAGYYTVRDKDRTGSISRVSGETLSKQPINNPLEGLIGRMAGVNIEPVSGVAGGGFKVEIRGRNSLRTDGREPLYLIDGVPYPSSSLTSVNLGVGGISALGSPLNYISPSDIESIEVLKDADATAIYGSRGSNGVILIKTKSTKANKSLVDINFYTGISNVNKKLALLNTSQYLEMRNEAFSNDGVAPAVTDYDVNGTWDKNSYTDWQKVLTGGTAYLTNLQTGISGGNEYTQFSFRANYNKQTTVYPGNFSDQKGSGTLTINHASLNKKFKVNFSSTMAIDYNKLPQIDLYSYILLALNAPKLHDAKGNLNWALDNNGSPTWVNPLATTRDKYSGKSNTTLSTAGLSYELLPNLFLKSNFGYTNIHLKENLLSPVSSKFPSPNARGSNRIVYNTVETWVVEPQVNYQKSIGKGQLDVLLGATFQKENQVSETIAGIGYTNDLLLESINAAPTKNALSSASQYNYDAVFGRLNYNYQSKYIINLTGRRDGSSRFGPDKQFANFGAVGIAWIWSKENFFNDKLSFLSFGKLRGSYGITGNDQIPNYGYVSTYSATQPYQDGTGIVPNRIANQDYSWETNKKLEVTLDLGFLEDRLSFSTSWYRNRSSNQLVGYALPDIAGFNTIQFNLPATVQNKGWEFELNTLNISGDSFSWKSALNLSIPRNKLLSYPNLKGSTYVNTYTVGSSLYTPITIHYLGVNPETGLYYFEDSNGDGNDLDLTAKKAANKPLTTELYGGLQNSLTFKNFQLDFLFQFVNKTVRDRSAFLNPPGMIGNQLIDVLGRWQKPGDVSDFQKFSQSFDAGGAVDRYGYSGYYSDHFADASFIRLKNLSFSWTLPASYVRKARLHSLRLYLQGQNLFTLTSYPLDPEVVFLRLPSMRTLTAGIQLTL